MGGVPCVVTNLDLQHGWDESKVDKAAVEAANRKDDILARPRAARRIAEAGAAACAAATGEHYNPRMRLVLTAALSLPHVPLGRQPANTPSSTFGNIMLCQITWGWQLCARTGQQPAV